MSHPDKPYRSEEISPTVDTEDKQTQKRLHKKIHQQIDIQKGKYTKVAKSGNARARKGQGGMSCAMS